jgi:hypothetical protein
MSYIYVRKALDMILLSWFEDECFEWRNHHLFYLFHPEPHINLFSTLTMQFMIFIYVCITNGNLIVYFTSKRSELEEVKRENRRIPFGWDQKEKGGRR